MVHQHYCWVPHAKYRGKADESGGYTSRHRLCCKASPALAMLMLPKSANPETGNVGVEKIYVCGGRRGKFHMKMKKK